MSKVDFTVDVLFTHRPFIVEVLTKANNATPQIEFPERGFHTIYEVQFETADGYVVSWAWVIGGYSNGIKYTVGVAVKGEEMITGWKWGHKNYVFVRPIPEEFINAVAHLRARRLFLLRELPNFIDDTRCDDDTGGWYSNGFFAMPLKPAKCLGEGARVWRVKEGAYVVFPDGTYRLMPFEEYLRIQEWGVPAYRQGDLLFFELNPSTDLANTGLTFVDKRHYEFDRHIMSAKSIYKDTNGQIFVEAPIMVKHLEHDTLEILEGQYEVALLPGSSRPFRGKQID